MTATLPGVGPNLGARIAIRVHGVPIPQGSKSASVINGRAVLRDANDKTLAPWRRHVTAAARDQTRYTDTIHGPIRVWVRFTFERPPSHYGSGRNAHLVKDSAPRFAGRACGDLDKLQRAIFDALTDAQVWHDDTQVVDVRARKFYAGEDDLALDQAGVDIILEELA